MIFHSYKKFQKENLILENAERSGSPKESNTEEYFWCEENDWRKQASDIPPGWSNFKLKYRSFGYDKTLLLWVPHTLTKD